MFPGDDDFTKTHLAFVVFNVSNLLGLLEGKDIVRFFEACGVGCTKLKYRRLSTALYVAMRMATRDGEDFFDFASPYVDADREMDDPCRFRW